jgi:hypothetical protein
MEMMRSPKRLFTYGLHRALSQKMEAFIIKVKLKYIWMQYNTNISIEMRTHEYKCVAQYQNVSATNEFVSTINE